METQKLTESSSSSSSSTNRGYRLIQTAALLGLLMALALSCKNTRLKGTSSALNATGATAATGLGDLYTITNATPNTSSSGQSSGTVGATGTSATTLTIYLDASRLPTPMTNHCVPTSDPTAPSSMPCFCKFSWNEINTQNGGSLNVNAITVPHTVLMPLTLVQTAVVQCSVPQLYNTEIRDDTDILISLVPGPGNPTAFYSNFLKFNKVNIVQNGNFMDAQGHSFSNIRRYGCYDQRIRGMSLKNRIKSITEPGGAGKVLKYPLASRYCLMTNANASSAGQDQECPNNDPTDYSTQSYYYNLFIRDSEVGDINPGNARYICPRVKETINDQGTIGTEGQYWPLDSSFALSLGKTTDFNVGVMANTKTSSVNDPTSQSSTCDALSSSGNGGGSSGGGGSAAAANTLVHSCLGFAAQPNQDGTCPTLTVQNPDGITTRQVPTYRLRRYVSIYPPFFDTDGKWFNEPQATDTVYVLDRPVANPAPVTDPRNPPPPFTMRGPKPCPFAFFDHKRALNPTPYPAGGWNNYKGRYAATNDPAWLGPNAIDQRGVNIDGIQFPNMDQQDPMSCSAALPLVNAAKNKVSIGTVNARNPAWYLRHVYVRPFKPFVPHYEEDLQFRACAPVSSVPKDPPLHFNKDNSGNVSWCAEVYPTQNDNVDRIDEPYSPGMSYTGGVQPYTSHYVKNIAGGTACQPTPLTTIPTNYPGPPAGLAWHQFNGGGFMDSQTCDRTVVNPPNRLGWSFFPLLAPESKTESALLADPAYQCGITWDNGGARSRAGQQPSGGCCGPIVTGYPAHMNINTACAVPTY